MKNIKFVVVILLFTGILSCKKEEETSVKGTVYDNTAQTYVSNFPIVLVEQTLSSGLHIFGVVPSDYSYDTLKKGVTDANGYYNFGMFPTRKNKKYTYLLNNKTLNKGQDNNISFTFYGSTILYVNFLPPPPYNIGDSLSVNFTPSINLNNKFRVTNTNDLYNNHLFISDGKYYININKFKSGVYTNIKDTVFYTNGTTNNYNVNW